MLRKTSRKRLGRLVRVEFLEERRLLAADPVINEFLALNRSSLIDEDGESPDWIEILNRGDQPMDLAGWHLTDDAGELTKWSFPPTPLAVGQHLVVLASGKDRVGSGPNGEHHTNFSLDTQGEYLALVAPNGETIVSEFAPNFPEQRPDYSYGIGRETVGDKLVAVGDTASVYIPANDDLERRWTGGDEPFDDTAPGWIQGPTGIGYDDAPAGAAAQPLGYWSFDGLAEDVSGNRHASRLTGGQYSDDVPAQIAGGQAIDLDGVDDRVEVEINVSEAAFTSSMWFKTTTPNRGLFAVVAGNLGPASDRHVYLSGGNIAARTWNNETISSVGLNLADGNWHHFAHVFGGAVGGQRVYVDGNLVASGSKSFSDFDWQDQLVIGFSNDGPSNFFDGLVDEVAVWNDALQAEQIQALANGRSPLRLGGYSSLINTDVQASMQTINGSAYLRHEFDYDASQAGDQLTLEVQYDDGFVAYLNGVEVARRNAPEPLTFASVATTDRSPESALRVESIDISQHFAALRNGSNVLAFQALNDSAASRDFLLAAELSVIRASADLYLSPPTPGSANLSGFSGFVADTKFDVERGFHDTPFDVTVTSATPGAWLAFTTDGTDPSPSNGMQMGPVDQATPPTLTLHIDSTTTLRVMAYKENAEASNIDTQTYVFVDDVVRQNVLWPTIVNDPIWGPQLHDSLLALPTVSIVSRSEPTLTEQAASIELIFPDGSKGFQIDAGIEEFGGHSLNSPKNNMRISFKSQYGPTKLNYDLFGEGAVTEFDQILLRTGSHDTFFWTHPGGARGNYIRGRWVFDRQLEMGQPAPHGRFVHVYINGVYWGQHHLMERPNASFMASYFGGEKEDYDALNAGAPVNGDATAWNNLVNSVGNFEQLSQYLDLENYADYMLLNFYGGNDWDWNVSQNWMAARKREPGAGFQFFGWDSDVILRTTAGANVINRGGPGNLWNVNGGVKQHQAFQRILADRAQRYFFDGGMFSDERLRGDIDALADEVRLSIIAETARWGSYSNYTPTSWQQAIDWVKDTFAPLNGPSRAETVIQQMRSAGVFPQLAAPDFWINGAPRGGGRVNAGDTLTLVSESVEQIVETPLVSAANTVSAYVPQDGQLLNEWWLPAYLEGAHGEFWRSGVNGAGYENGSGYQDLINIDLTSEMTGAGANNSVYLRYEFRAPDQATLAEWRSLTLKMIADDGFVAYLNGTRIASANAPPSGQLSWNSAAPSAIEADVNAPVRFDVTAWLNLLNAGGVNVLAIQGLNASPTSSDMLIRAELVGETLDENAPLGNLYYTLDGSDPSAPEAIAYQGPLSIAETITIRARQYDNGQWSPLREATFLVHPPASADTLAITEINYHPFAPTADELILAPDWTPADFEFLELRNISQQTIDLTGVRIVDGVDFDFTRGDVTALTPDQRVLVVRNAAAFQARYGTLDNVAGTFAGGLSDGGEGLHVLDGAGATIAAFDYNDGGAWPGRADGNGSSLEIIVAGGGYQADNWRSSTEYGGSPGAEGLGAYRDVVINEVLTHTDLPAVDFVELFNPTGQDIDVGGWFLSDSTSDYRKYQIVPSTTLPAGGYLVLDESDFNPTAGASPTDFAFDGAHGDDVWLVAADAQGKPARFADHVEFDAAANGESFGRWPNADGELYPMTNVTLGSANSGPRFGPLLISEIMYHPADPDGVEGIDPENLEFIEIHNPATYSVELSQWEIRGGVDFVFPGGTTLAASEALLIVAFDPTEEANAQLLSDFRDVYGLGADVAILGGYSGKLANGSERVSLFRPDAPPLEEPDFFPLLLEDEIRYQDQSPWSAAADGQGASLTRVAPASWGNSADSWIGAEPTPGSTAEMPIRVISVIANAGLPDPSNLPAGAQPSGWMVQQSRLATIQVVFSKPVALAFSDLVLTNLGVDAPAEPDLLISLEDAQLTIVERVATISFETPLAEGVYQLRILPSATDLQGIALDGDADGQSGGTFRLDGNAANGLYRLNGDFNGDGGVSIFDFPTFAYWFGATVPRAPEYADLNGDGGITIFDFPLFAGNFGASITPPADFASEQASAFAFESSRLKGNRQPETDMAERTSDAAEDVRTNWAAARWPVASTPAVPPRAFPDDLDPAPDAALEDVLDLLGRDLAGLLQPRPAAARL